MEAIECHEKGQKGKWMPYADAADQPPPTRRLSRRYLVPPTYTVPPTKNEGNRPHPIIWLRNRFPRPLTTLCIANSKRGARC